MTVETLSSCCIGNRGCHVRTLAKTQGPILMNKKQLMQDMVPFSICLGSSFSLWENPVNYLPNFYENRELLPILKVCAAVAQMILISSICLWFFFLLFYLFLHPREAFELLALKMYIKRLRFYSFSLRLSQPFFLILLMNSCTCSSNS